MTWKVPAIGILVHLILGWTGLFSQNASTIRLKLDLPLIEIGTSNKLYRQYGLKEDLIPLSKVEGLMESILTLYEDEGYPFASARLDTIRIDNRQLSGSVEITPGIRVTVDSILNRTGYRLSPRVIQRILNIRPGDIYSESVVSEANTRLSRMACMEQKRPLEVGFHEDKASVFVYPAKASTNRFDGWIGLTPASASSSKMGFAGTINLGLNNLTGMGETWDFKWRRNQDRSQQLKVGLNLPYFLGSPFGIDGMVDFYRQDTSYFNLFADAGIPYYFTPDNKLSLIYRYRASDLLYQEPAENLADRRSYRISLTGLSWKFATTDNQISPTKGIQFLSEFSIGSRSIADSLPHTRSEGDIQVYGYLPVYSKLVLTGSFNGGIILAPDVLENECFRIGGVGDLIGFDEDVFRTDRYLIGAGELRFLLDPGSYLLIRVNGGLVGQSFNHMPKNIYPVGFGVGGQVKTGGGIFRIMFALGTDPEYSLQLSNGKIHIGYVGLF